MSFWAVMLICGLLTFLIRLSFIAVEGRMTPPAWFRAALPFVPIAALTALIAPDLLLVDQRLSVIANPRLAAGMVAAAVAWRWRRATLTIVSGFLVLFLLHNL